MSDGRPDISVVIPVYRDEERLRRCLGALERQELAPGRFEVVVANNDPARPPALPEVPFALLMVDEPAAGSYAARNAGIRAASASLLAFTDADCVPAGSWLARGLELLSEADLVAGKVEFFFEGEEPGACEYLDAATKLNQQVYAEAGFGATANLFVRREVFERCGLFDDSLRSGGDYEFGRRATGAGFQIRYGKAAAVRHPARASFLEMLRKSARVARGQKRLAEAGVLEHGTLSARKLLPLWRIPETPSGYRPSFGQRLKIFFMMNIRKYLNIWIRWTG